MKKILVIEDEKLSRNNLVKILQAEGFEVVGVENSLIGLKLAIEQKPDLIICDIMMPELDGYEVLTALQADPNTAIIPLIFLTAKTEIADRHQGVNLGADDYLMKPFEVGELLEAISARFKSQEIRQRNLQALIEQPQKSADFNNTTRTNLQWDLKKLYADLVLAKQQIKNSSRQVQLTSLEKACLLGLLSGHSPIEIATQLNREPKGLAVDLCRGLYRYIERLTGQTPKNWRDIPLLLSKQKYYGLTSMNHETLSSSPCG